MIVAIIGSRTFDDYDLLKSVMLPFLSSIEKIITGGAKGADTLGEKWSYDCLDKSPIIVRPQWRDLSNPDALIKEDRNGQAFDARAGLRRNEQIVKQADLIIAFWDEKSKGTRHVIQYSNQLGKEIKVIKYKKQLQLAFPFQ